MKTVKIADLKAHLSEHLRAVRAGETLTVLDRERPVARIVPHDGEEDDLLVVRGRGRLHDVVLPQIRGAVDDVVVDLLAERRERG